MVFKIVCLMLFCFFASRASLNNGIKALKLKEKDIKKRLKILDECLLPLNEVLETFNKMKEDLICTGAVYKDQRKTLEKRQYKGTISNSDSKNMKEKLTVERQQFRLVVFGKMSKMLKDLKSGAEEEKRKSLKSEKS